MFTLGVAFHYQQQTMHTEVFTETSKLIDLNKIKEAQELLTATTSFFNQGVEVSLGAMGIWVLTMMFDYWNKVVYSIKAGTVWPPFYRVILIDVCMVVLYGLCLTEYLVVRFLEEPYTAFVIT